MNLKQLEYFAKIVECNFNLSKAAKQLYLTQPSLSMLISDLESEHNVKLLKKVNGRYKELTAEGQEVYQKAKQILQIKSSLEYTLDQASKSFSGNITIGIPPIIISLLFSEMLPNFIHNYSDINVTVVEKGAAELHNLLLEDKLDFAVLIDPLDYSNLNRFYISEGNLGVFCRNDFKFANKKAISIQDIKDEELVTLSEDFIIQKTIINLFNNKNLVPNIIFKSGQWDLLIQLVRNLNAITILPMAVGKLTTADDIVFKPLQEKAPWNVCIASKTGKVLSSEQKCFLDSAIKYFNAKAY